MSIWIAGLQIAGELNLEYVHTPLSRDPADRLGLSAGRLELATVKESLRFGRIVHLPPAPDERDSDAFSQLRSIVARKQTSEGRRLFVLSMDQPWWDQTPASAYLRSAYWGRNAERPNLTGDVAADTARIAVHVRRGDLVQPTSRRPGRHANRWVGLDWYDELFFEVRSCLEPAVACEFHIYCIGSCDDFGGLGSNHSVVLHMDGDLWDDLRSMILSDLLIAAPSSFSFTAGLISENAVIGRWPWWHHIPDTDRWFRYATGTTLDARRLRSQVISAIGRRAST